MAKTVRCWVNLMILLAISGCNFIIESASQSTKAPNLYLPPTLANPALSSGIQNATNLPPVTNSPPTSTPLPNCTDNLVYIEDLTIPDGSVVNPGELLDKQWKVENAGTCNWDARYRLQLIAGPALNAPNQQALYPARSGSMATIRIVFTAPPETGRYRSAWQAFNPQGEPFGDPIFIEFVVEIPTPTP